ncbi:MAG: proton-conducting transporter membrane subunit [Candidatus Nanopelagicales bacterium]
MTALVWIPLLVPLLTALVSWWRRDSGWARTADLAVAVVVLGSGMGLLAGVDLEGPVVAGGGALRADSLSAWLLFTIGAVAVTALWGGLPTRAARVEPDGRYSALICLFLAAMSLAVLSDNLGILWVAIEATTITTAFLVGHHRTRRSLEAAWKYVVLGSVGVAIAFLGIVLIYAAAAAAGTPTLSWRVLASGAIALDPDLTRIAVALAVLGFATKAGLAPMHSWLPDAHSQAPAPVSGLMSGVLLSVALYAILRVQAIGDVILGPGFLRGLLVAGGLLSLGVAAALILAQRDFKRMLAYSSIEHMGIMALGAAVGGPLATAAVLLHMLGHGLVKAASFVVAGRILAAEGSSRTADVTALLARRPDLARPLLAGTAALLGFPPFVLFFTEVAIVVAGWQVGLGWAMGIALALLLVVFAGLARHVSAMTLGEPTSGSAGPDGAPNDPADLAGSGPATSAGVPEHVAAGRQAPLLIALGAAAVLGLLVIPMAALLSEAASVLAGAR